MKVVAVPDKLRDTATAREAAAAIGRGARAAGWACTEVPMADGGEGTLEVLGGTNRIAVVTGPLGAPVRAAWRRADGRAVIEMAQASGLALVSPNDPMAASTRGTGELILAALAEGCDRMLVGLGGSATTDGGRGALEALAPLEQLSGIEVIAACDVRTRFVDAAPLFAPQKGATPAQVEVLRQRLESLAESYLAEYGIDVREVPGSGSAGGLAGGLLCAGARLVPGFDAIAGELGLDAQLVGADLLVTAEGNFDDGSLDGKVVGGVAALGARRGIPVLAVVGDEAGDSVRPAGLTVVSLVERFGPRRARADTVACIEEVVGDHLRRWT